jgi:hypothetical protein
MQALEGIEDVDKIENFQTIKTYLDEPLENLYTRHDLSHDYLVNLHNTAKISTVGELGYLYDTDELNVYEILGAESIDNDEQTKLLTALDYAKKLYKRGIKLHKKDQKQNQKIEKELLRQQQSNQQIHHEVPTSSTHKELVASTISAVEESLASIKVSQNSKRSPFLDYHERHQSPAKGAPNTDSSSPSVADNQVVAEKGPEEINDHEDKITRSVDQTAITIHVSSNPIQYHGVNEATVLGPPISPPNTDKNTKNPKIYEDQILSLQLVITRLQVEKVEQQNSYEGRIRKLEATVSIYL